jgi:hypothetical protein
VSSSEVGRAASRQEPAQPTHGERSSSPAARAVSTTRRRLALFGGILVVTFLSRIPFLDAGYGRINDGWRVASAAREIATTGRYAASRFPPHPVQELVCSLFWRQGAVAFNAATAFMSALAVLFFALSMDRLRIAGILEASAALAFAPVIFVNSTSSLDYLWALAFILGSFYFVLDRKPILAGIFLGLAIGSRITSGAMLLPLLILAWRTLDPDKRIFASAKLVAAAGVVGIATFVPVVARYGLSFWTFIERGSSAEEVLGRASTALWGRLGVAAIVLSLAWWVFRMVFRRPSVRPLGVERRTVVLVCIVSIALYVIAFVRLPHVPAYLIPAMPFVLLLLAILLERPVFRVVCIAVALSSFAIVGRSGLSAGPIFEDHRYRIEAMDYTKRIVEIGRTLTRRTIVVAGKWAPKIEVYVPEGRSGPVQYVYLVNDKELRGYQEQGFDVYFLPGQRSYNFNRYGVDLPARGVKPLVPDSAGWHW